MRTGVRGDRHLGAHRHVDGHAVARLDAEGDEALGEACDGPRELGEGPLAPLSVLAGEDGPDGLRAALRPSVYAIPRHVELAADEPGRPLGPAREIDDPLPGLEEVEAHVLDRRGPKPLRIFLRAPHQCPVVVEAVAPHETHDVCTFEHLRGRFPDDLRHVAQSTVVLT